MKLYTKCLFFLLTFLIDLHALRLAPRRILEYAHVKLLEEGPSAHAVQVIFENSYVAFSDFHFPVSGAAESKV